VVVYSSQFLSGEEDAKFAEEFSELKLVQNDVFVDVKALSTKQVRCVVQVSIDRL
jgi:hypothetical protein